MNKKFAKRLLILVVFSIILSAAGCQNSGGGDLPTGTNDGTPLGAYEEMTTPIETEPQETTTALTTPISTTNGNTSSENPPEEEIDLSKINKLREDYQHGTCKNLQGNVSVVLFYMDDFESVWTNGEMDSFTANEVEPGLRFLENEAEKYGVTLNLEIKEVYRSVPYNGEVITSTKETGLATIDVLSQAANHAGYYSTSVMIKALRYAYKTDEVICLTVFNKNGTGYSINPKKNVLSPLDEHCILFVRDRSLIGNAPAGSQASIVAHEILYLFGAENFYASASREQLAEKLYKSDIMLNIYYDIAKNSIGDATAFYIGWIHKVPDVLYDSRWN